MDARIASHPSVVRRAALLCTLVALALPLLAMVTTRPAAAATPGEVTWARIVPGVATAGGDRVIDVAPGPAGTFYALGVYNEPSFTGWTWVARYAANGRKLWVKKYGEAQGIDANCWAMTVDRAGNLVVAGSRRPMASADSDMLVLKYAQGGRLVWTRSYAGPGFGVDVATSVCADAAGNVYAGGFATQAGGTYSAFAVVRWTAGGHRDWVTTIESLTPGPGDGATSMVSDGQGATYLTGHVQDSPTTTACLTAKVSATGTVLWQQLFAPGAVFNEGVSIGRRGSVVYVAGRASDDGAAATVFLAKYAAGTGSPSTVSWSAFTQSMFDPLALAVGADGSAWVTSNVAAAGGLSSAALERFAPVPGQSWSWSNPDPAFQSQFSDVVVDGAGRAWAVGYMMDVATLDNNAYAAAFSAEGSELWNSVWRRPTGDSAAGSCACLLGSGGVAAGGWANGTVTARDPLLLRIER